MKARFYSPSIAICIPEENVDEGSKIRYKVVCNNSDNFAASESAETKILKVEESVLADQQCLTFILLHVNMILSYSLQPFAHLIEFL